MNSRVDHLYAPGPSQEREVLLDLVLLNTLNY